MQLFEFGYSELTVEFADKLGFAFRLVKSDILGNVSVSIAILIVLSAICARL